MSATTTNQKPWRAVLSVLALLGLVAFIVGYLLRPDFIISFPEMTVAESGVTVSFEATNQSDEPTTRKLVVSIGERGPKAGGAISYPALDRRELTVEIAPGETKKLQCDFPPQKTKPTLSWVELAK